MNKVYSLALLTLFFTNCKEEKITDNNKVLNQTINAEEISAALDMEYFFFEASSISKLPLFLHKNDGTEPIMKHKKTDDDGSKKIIYKVIYWKNHIRSGINYAIIKNNEAHLGARNGFVPIEGLNNCTRMSIPAKDQIYKIGDKVFDIVDENKSDIKSIDIYII